MKPRTGSSTRPSRIPFKRRGTPVRTSTLTARTYTSAAAEDAGQCEVEQRPCGVDHGAVPPVDEPGVRCIDVDDRGEPEEPDPGAADASALGLRRERVRGLVAKARHE